jgi:chromate reductase
MSSIHVLGFSGSLRKASFNSALLRAAGGLVPAGMTLEPFDLEPIPLYNQDLVVDGAWPVPVARMREAIRAADALLFVSPEYNHSISGVLKNAIDWASRGPEAPLDGKPAAIMGASGGRWGTARGQLALRQVCVFTNIHPLNRPEVLVAQAKDKFDDQLQLVDQTTRDIVASQLEALKSWTLRLTR